MNLYESIKNNLKENKSLKESFFNPGKYFLIVQEEYSDIDTDKWNSATQEERDAMVRPQLQEFWDKYKEEMTQADLNALFDDMEDSNFHTESRILEEIIRNDRLKKESEDEWTEEDYKQYAIGNAPEDATEEDINKELMWSYVCSNKLDLAKKLLDNGFDPNIRYHRFNHDNSFIMGALRNGNYDMVDLLKSYGGTITRDELDEYKSEMAKHTYEDDITKSSPIGLKFSI